MVSKGSCILAVCHDAGGARAVIPVVKELKRRGASVVALVAGPAATIWPNECPGGDCIEVPDGISVDAVDGLLEQLQIETVFSASGLYNTIEHTVRVAAQKRGLYSVGVLDSWLNYAERFQRISDRGPEKYHPDRVCVMDDLSYRGMLSAGFKPDQVVITGPPNLEATVNFCLSISPEQRKKWRMERGLLPNDFVITFFSDPFYVGPDGETITGPGALIGPDGQSLFGYTSLGILETVLEELAVACETAGRSCKLIVKPHPIEYAECLRPVVERKGHSQWVDVLICAEGNATEWVVLSDTVVGMMSIALLEAALTGKPALSVEIGLSESKAEEPCISNLLGYTFAIYNRAALHQAMYDICIGNFDRVSAPRKSALQVQGAAQRVALVVLQKERDYAIAERN